VSVGKSEPVPLFGKTLSWGISRHGLIQNAQMTLGNSSQIAWPQPGGNGGAVWSFANTLLVRRPGWTGPVLPPEEVAANLAAGHELLDYAILSGGTGDVGGQQIGANSWLWFDPAGACWRFQISSLTGPHTARVFAFSRRRFGLIGDGLHTSTTVTASAIDLGQDGAPPIDQLVLINGLTPHTPIPADVVMETRLVSTTPGGDKALFMCCIRPWTDSTAPNEDAQEANPSALDHRPLAFVEVTVATDGTVTAQTVRNRAACLGTYSGSLNMGYLIIGWGLAVVAEEPFTCPSGQNVVRKTFDIVFTETPTTNQNDGPGTGNETQSLTGGVIAMWYDANSVLHEITLDLTRVYDRAVTVIAQSSGGPSIWEPLCDSNGGSFGPTITGTSGYSWVITESLTVELRDNGVVVPGAGIALVRSESGVKTESRTWPEYAFNTDNPMSDPAVFVSTNNLSVTLNGAPLYSLVDHFNVDGRNPLSLPIPELRTQYFAFPQLWAGRGGNPGVVLDLVRWSNNAVGARHVITNGQTTQINHFGDVVTPSGAVAHSETFELPGGTFLFVWPIPLAFVAPRMLNCSGSWHPVTQEFVSSVSELAEGVVHFPKCWA
jgi:hypothetical protein